MRSVLFLINLAFSIVEILLGFRFLLKLFGANSGAPFVAWIYDMSAALLNPFTGTFPASTLARGSVLEFTTLFALIIYALIQYLLIEFILFINHVSVRGRRRVVVDEDHDHI